MEKSHHGSLHGLKAHITFGTRMHDLQKMIHCVLVYISSISVQEMISSKILKRLIEDGN